MQYGQQESSLNISQLHRYAMDVVEAVCGVFTMPIEIILRPQYGTRYFPGAHLLFLEPADGSAASVLIGGGQRHAHHFLWGITAGGWPLWRWLALLPLFFPDLPSRLPPVETDDLHAAGGSQRV